MSKLIELADSFLSLAQSKTSVIKNNNEILSEISSLEDFEDRVELADENFDKLGEGSSRTIFQISDSLVLKVAHNDKGIAQNMAEMKPSMHCDCTNGVLAADSDGKWVIVRFTEQMTEEDFKDIIGIGFKSFMKTLYWSFNNEIHEGKPDDYDEIKNSPYYKCLSKIVLENQLQIGDVAKASSWGLLDGKPVLRDFGLTKDVFVDFYEDDSSNETSTI